MHYINNKDLIPRLSIFRLGVVICFVLLITADTLYPEAQRIDIFKEELNQIREAAVRGLTSLLKAIPIKDLGYYNFSDQKELDQATLENPFRIYTIVPERILNYSPEVSVEEIISPTFVWLFPVISKGETRTLLTVDFMDGEWRAVAIGRSGLARQWASIMELWPSSEGYEHTFVRIFQAKADFVIISRLEETKMIPLESGCVSLGIAEAEVYNPSEIIFKLQKPVRDNIESSQFIDQKK